jgi:hypothetical protein
MIRLFAILLFITPAFADNGALATCEAQNMELVASNKNLADLNAQLGEIAESFRSQLEARKVQVVRIEPVATKPGQRKAGTCGSQRQKWYVRADGRKMYRCK